MKRKSDSRKILGIVSVVCFTLVMMLAGCDLAQFDSNDDSSYSLSNNSNNPPGNNSNNSNGGSDNNSNGGSDNTIKEPEVDDLSKVETEYILSAGHYTVGIDIPAGRADITAVSGGGNLMSSDMFFGGLNEVFGIDNGLGLYTSEYKNLSLTKDLRLSLNFNLVIKMTYTSIDSNYSGRSYDETKAIELPTGSYTAGTDFPAGVYKIVAVSGNGNLISSNIFNGGVNEIFGVDTSYGIYNSQFLNAELKSGGTLTVSGGLVIRMIPAN